MIAWYLLVFKYKGVHYVTACTNSGLLKKALVGDAEEVFSMNTNGEDGCSLDNLFIRAKMEARKRGIKEVIGL